MSYLDKANSWCKPPLGHNGGCEDSNGLCDGGRMDGDGYFHSGTQLGHGGGNNSPDNWVNTCHDIPYYHSSK